MSMKERRKLPKNLRLREVRVWYILQWLWERSTRPRVRRDWHRAFRYADLITRLENDGYFNPPLHVISSFRNVD